MVSQHLNKRRNIQQQGDGGTEARGGRGDGVTGRQGDREILNRPVASSPVAYFTTLRMAKLRPSIARSVARIPLT